jgi:hypothetical protein
MRMHVQKALPRLVAAVDAVGVRRAASATLQDLRSPLDLLATGSVWESSPCCNSTCSTR